MIAERVRQHQVNGIGPLYLTVEEVRELLREKGRFFMEKIVVRNLLTLSDDNLKKTINNTNWKVYSVLIRAK